MKLQGKQAEWLQETLERTVSKLEKVSRRSKDKIPYTTENGVHDDWSGERIGWWTNGFWGGMMWQLYVYTKDEFYRQVALENEEKLDADLMDYEKMDHDNGFKWLPTAVADYRLTKDKAARNRGLLAAANLAGRYNSLGRYIRAWNGMPTPERDCRGWAIIDCMMNLPLLYWAGEELADPRFTQIARNHADTAMRCFIRGDGSANHIVEFDLETGEMVKSYGGQGYGEGSSWTRGQSWALYGFTLSYIHTKEQAYLETAQRVANYFIANIPESGLIPVDFRQPEEVSWQDSTAAAIAACGLIELSRQFEGRQAEVYLQAAVRLLQALSEKSVNWDESQDNLLEKCTAAYHDKAHEFSIIYGDYYFLEALLKLADRDLFVW
ncbi:MAG: glycoside hydrolase family 88 protein [Eubacteriales bacterium]|nr:glycoside hydrolase family 88 protein [Eubacteriales bacterium]